MDYNPGKKCCAINSKIPPLSPRFNVENINTIISNWPKCPNID